MRVFDVEDFYFSVLDSSYTDSSNPSVGLSMLGANRLYNELDLLGQVFDNYVNDNDAEIYAINEHLAISDGSIIKTNSSVSDLEFRIGQFNFDNNYIYAVNSSDGDSDLDVADSSGNVILRLNEGHIQTKNFNSIDCSAFDFDKDYPYIISHVYSERDESDFDLADSSGNVLVRFVNGHIKTKNFDSENIDSMNASIISYIDTKDQEVLSNCLDQIDDISKTVDGLKEDYRNYKVEVNTNFTNFKNDVNAENSSFRDKFESYWIECEDVVAAAMTDLDLKIQTLGSSLNLVISDTNSSIISYIDAKDGEVLNNCLNQINDISKTVDDCKNDVSIYKKEFDKLNNNFNILNDNFNILNNNVSTYKNSVTSLQEDYRSYKIQINTDFTNFKNNINAENSSFREKFESYWVECEQVVAEAMSDLDLKIQTLDSSFHLAISDFVNSSIISYIDAKDQEVLTSCLDQIDNISKTVDDCKNDVSVYKKEFDKLNSNFNILNNNVSTYKNSVTSLQEDYRSYKIQIETSFTNFKNNVNAENSSFREKFESYWVECEQVVAEAMSDLDLKIQTLDSSFHLAISDFVNSSIISYIDAKDQEVLTSCLDQIDNISKTVDDCKNDVSVYKKEFDKLNSNFNILNDNVNTYKNSVTSLQEDYRNYKTQIETAFTDFKNNVNVENSSFREKFESYWIECEDVVKEAMNDLSLQIQTLDSSLNLAISDILSRLDALENKS